MAAADGSTRHGVNEEASDLLGAGPDQDHSFNRRHRLTVSHKEHGLELPGIAPVEEKQVLLPTAQTPGSGRLSYLSLYMLLFVHVAASVGAPAVFWYSSSGSEGASWEACACFFPALICTKVIEYMTYLQDPAFALDGGTFALRFISSIFSYADAYAAAVAASVAWACEEPDAQVISQRMAIALGVGVVAAQWVVLPALAAAFDPSRTCLTKILHMDTLASVRSMPEDGAWLYVALIAVRLVCQDLPQACIQALYLTQVQLNTFVIVALVVTSISLCKALGDAYRCKVEIGEKRPLDGLQSQDAGAALTDGRRLTQVGRTDAGNGAPLLNDLAKKQGSREAASANTQDYQWVQKASAIDLWAKISTGGRRKMWCSSKDERRKEFMNKSIKESGDDLDAATEKIGFTCRKGLKPEGFNQDAWCVLREPSGLSIYGVFDGHGPKGELVSAFCAEGLPKLLLADQRVATPGVKTLLREAFVKCQSLIGVAHAEKAMDADFAGTTGTILVHDAVQKKLYLAHVGDSRAAVARQTAGITKLELVTSTEDHKPILPGEKARIERSGGAVIFDGFYNHRVFAKGKSYPGLNMSRCLGDLCAHRECGVSCEPEVAEHDIQPDDKVILLCSDGVWEFIDEHEALKIISNFGPSKAQEAADALAKESYKRWMQDTDNQAADDITAVVIYLQ